MSLVALGVLSLLSVVSSEVPGFLSATSYDLILNLDLINTPNAFQGDATVRLRTSNSLPQNVYSVVLHGLNLKLTYIELQNIKTTAKFKVDPDLVSINQKEGTVTLPLKAALEKSTDYSLRIVYNANITEEVYGLVKTTDGYSSFLTTSLYPGAARRLYPCLDLPNIRATYSLTLIVKYAGDAPVIVTGLYKVKDSSSKGNLHVQYNSNKTSLPPYGIAFTIGNYKTGQEKGLSFPATMKTQLISQDLVFARKTRTIEDLISAGRISDFEIVIVPGLPVESVSGFAFTAVSNDLSAEYPASSSSLSLKDHTTSILRAIVRSIYGTQVSPATWQDIWITEATSLYLSSVALNQITRWADWADKGTLEVQQVALSGSWSEDSRPVRPDSYSSVEEVLQFLSDPAVYKGASVLGMIETVPKSSANGNIFIDIIKESTGKAISTDEFLDIYEKLAHLNETLPHNVKLKDLVSPWLKQTGYPAVSISRKNSDIIATQSRFRPNKNTQSTWLIPIWNTHSTTESEGTTKLSWLNSEPNAEFKLAENVNENDTVIANVRGPGLYRVQYDLPDLLLLGRRLTNQIDFAPTEVRTALVSDGLAFARAGSIPYSYLLNMLRFVDEERELWPLDVVSRGLREMWSLLYYSDLLTQFEVYATDLLRYSYIDPEIGGLGLSDSSLYRGVIRRHIVSQMLDYEDLTCQQDTLAAFRDVIVSGKRNQILAADVAPILYCSGLRDVSDLTVLLTYLHDSTYGYKPADPSDVKRNLFYYLACPQNETVIKGYLKSIFVDSTLIEAKDLVIAAEEVARRPEHVGKLIDFLINNFDKLNKGLNEKHKAQIVAAIGKTTSTSDHLSKLKSLSGKSSTVKEAVDKAVAATQERIDFLKANYDDIKIGLYGNHPTPKPTVNPSSTTNPTTTTNPSSSTTEPSSGAASTSAAVALIVTVIAALCFTH